MSATHYAEWLASSERDAIRAMTLGPDAALWREYLNAMDAAFLAQGTPAGSALVERAHKALNALHRKQDEHEHDLDEFKRWIDNGLREPAKGQA